MHSILKIAAAVALLVVAGAPGAQAGVVSKSYDFALDQWHALDDTDGPVTLHRVRLDRQEGRLTKSALARPHNQQYLSPLRVQLEYSNEASRKWRARVTARWLDEEGRIIDGISANETLDKKSARKVVQFSLSTLKYGVQRAKTLEVSVHYDP